MKHYYIRHILLCLCLLTGINVSAYNAEIDGIYYNFSGNTATVTYQKYENGNYLSDYSGDVVIPESVSWDGKTYSVTSIGDYAFRNCNELTSVSIPSSVTSIGWSAFYNCTSLTSFTIPEGVTNISSYAFSGCKNLATIIFPNSVTTIGYSVLEDTPWYKNQPDGMVYAGKVAYKYKGSMPNGTQITLEEGTLGIAGLAFQNCSGLTSVTIPNGVTDIGNSAFYGCRGLTSISLPNSLTYIDTSAFGHCTGLSSIIIPENVTYIAPGAFVGCANLTSITVEKGNTKYDSREGCNGIVETETNTLTVGCQSTVIHKSITAIGYKAYYGCYNLTSITIPENVTSIGNWAFRDCTSLTSITIPNSVTSIGNYAFSGCSSLTSVTIPESVTAIGYDAFSGCKMPRASFVNNSSVTDENNWGAILFDQITDDGLIISNSVVVDCEEWATSVNIPNGITGIGEQAFVRCWRSLTSVTIPNSVTYIGNSAFMGCGSLASVTIPNSVTSIGDAAFTFCENLASVTIPNSVTSIGREAFIGCSSLTSITIPNSVTKIEPYTFYDCGLTSIKIGSGVTYIDEGAFWGCKNLTSVTIPNSVTSIGGYAFAACESLTSITIPNSVTSIGGYAFADSKSLASITIPNSVTSIGGYAFAGCYSLASITIPNSVTRIEPYTFAGCGLTSIKIGSGVTYIDEGAFLDCRNLTDVYCLAENVPETNQEYGGIFNDTPIEDATLHVPASALEAYRTTEPWSSFGAFDPIEVRCATPTIGYAGGKLTFKCETEGVTFIYNIKDDDIKYGAGSEVNLSVAYQISVYATKGGIADSEVATATLCWVDQQPEAEGLTDEDAVLEMKALPVLIQTQGGTISVRGIDDGMEVSAYSVDGKKEGFAISEAGQAVVNTNLTSGSIAVIKIGEKAIKVQMK